MLTTRGKLTVAQATRPAVTAECVPCGASAVFLVEQPDASVDHRCGTDLVGPTWSLIERPRTARRRPAPATVLFEGEVLTAEQARVQALAIAPHPGAEAVA